MHGFDDVIEGDIVYAFRVPSSGGSPGADRRVAIIGVYDTFLLGVGISRSVPANDADIDYYCVLLPWDPRKHPKTSLNARCGAFSNWGLAVVEVPTGTRGECRFDRWTGEVPDKELGLIYDKFEHAYAHDRVRPFRPAVFPPPA